MYDDKGMQIASSQISKISDSMEQISEFIRTILIGRNQLLNEIGAG